MLRRGFVLMGCPDGFGSDLIHQNRSNTNEHFTIRAGANGLRVFLESVCTRKEAFNRIPEPSTLDGRRDATAISDKKVKPD
jgi:hypothetical protein